MNFYASREYLDAAASVYFKDRDTAIEDVRIGEDVLRLLVVEGKRIVTTLQFLDVHQPLSEAERLGPVRQGRYARHVVRGTIRLDEENALPGCDLAPYVDWSGFAGYGDYAERLLQRHRGLVRDRERRTRSLASAHGEPVFLMNDTADDVLALAQQWKSRQLRDSGHRDWMSDPQTIEFLETLRERNLLVSSSLRIGGRLVSIWIGFVYRRAWSGWIFTYDPEFRKYSVGHQLLSRMLEESHRLGHREFDFSDGRQDYKLMYSTHARLLGDIGKPPLARSLADFAKNTLGKHSPALLGWLQGARAARPAQQAGS
jgi:hypothetical protein